MVSQDFHMTAPELDKAEPLTNHEVALVKAVAEPLNAEIARLNGEVAELRQKLEAAERALRCIAEGNLGDWPGQANYERIRAVAARALANQGEGNG